jgi:hypothetical protein
MSKFKQFLIKEEFGLGDIKQKINKIFDNKSYSNFLSSSANNTYDYSPWRGNDSINNQKEPVDLVIPNIEKTARIIFLDVKKTPIRMLLSDGTECLFSEVEFRKIKGIPEINKTITLVFQRNPNDFSKNFSKIEKAIVLD